MKLLLKCKKMEGDVDWIDLAQVG